MAYDGNGNYTVPPGTAAVTGALISSTAYNALLSDLQTALTKGFLRDGQSAALANLPMGGFKLTGLAAGTNPNDSVRFDQLGTAAVTPVLGGLTIADFTFDHSTPAQYVAYSNTNPLSWNTDVGCMTVDYEVTLNGYFAANPDAHFATVLRCDTAVIASYARGQGIVFGDATGFAQPSTCDPTPMIETWFNGLHGTGNYLWAQSDGGRSNKMVDGGHYRFIIDTKKARDGNRYIRYRMYVAGLVDTWQMVVDSGDVLDHNEWADLTKTGLVFANVFESNLSTWSINFANIKVTWGPGETAVTDQTVKLARFGAQLEGDLEFIGNARRILTTYNAGPSLVNSTTIQSATNNTATGLVIKPRGTSQSAGLLLSNHSTSDTVYQALDIGANGSEVYLNTFNRGSSDLVLNLKSGGSTKMTISGSGVSFPSATKFVGASFPTGVTNFGAAATAAWAASSTIDFEAAVCADGAISTFLGSSYNQVLIELAILPTARLLSVLIAELKKLRIIS